MTDKDFVQLNEKELGAVAGGVGELFGSETIIFKRKKTAEEALAYLKEKGIHSSRISFYMQQWYSSHD